VRQSQVSLALCVVLSYNILFGVCRGCGNLQELQLKCPALRTLVANFCKSLSDSTMQKAVRGAPALLELTLSVCLSLGPAGLSTLSALRHLRTLDISYTSVQACPFNSSSSSSFCIVLTRFALLRPFTVVVNLVIEVGGRGRA
jgi:hypothetical protein